MSKICGATGNHFTFLNSALLSYLLQFVQLCRGRLVVFVAFAKLDKQMEHNSSLPILMFEAVSILDQFLLFSGDDVMRV